MILEATRALDERVAEAEVGEFRMLRARLPVSSSISIFDRQTQKTGCCERKRQTNRVHPLPKIEVEDEDDYDTRSFAVRDHHRMAAD
jgi:hypothetical protein